MTSAMLDGLRALAASLPRGTPVPVPSEVLRELLGSSDYSGEAPLPEELTQREAASLLRVSVSYLRASSCPKHLLPGNGARGRPLVRYRRDDVLAWGAARSLAPQTRRA